MLNKKTQCGLLLVENESMEIKKHFEMFDLPYKEIDGIDNLLNSKFKYIIISYEELFARIDTNFLIEILNTAQRLGKKLIVSQMFWDEATFMCNTLLDKSIREILMPYAENLFFLYSGVLEESTKQELNMFNLVQIGSGEMWDEIEFVEKTSGLERTDNFLLTMVIRKHRPGRVLLKTYLDEHNLLDYNLGAVNIEQDNDVIVNVDNGQKHIGNWNLWNLYMQWPLYEKCTFEIVPETSHNNLTFPTEKTYKPMVAQVPFLILANPEYYNWLHDLGFRTFNSLIDESFASEPDLEKRVQKLANTAKYIVEQGSLDFYHATKEICKHNREHLMYTQIKELTDARQKFWNFYSELK
jgi:hypothetical protein